MAIYKVNKVNKIELENASGTVCKLKCYYKITESDTPKTIGSTGNFSLGKSRTLNLSEIADLPDGAWVTAYADVSGKDSASDVWFIYDKNYDATASFEITGTAFKTKVAFKSISEMYGDDLINGLKLNNQSGTVCTLECYYKKEKEEDPKRTGSTGNITVGFSGKLNLDNLDLPDMAWVTAYANVKAGSDDFCPVWFRYKKGNKKCAEYTISGVINFTTVTFNNVDIDNDK